MPSPNDNPPLAPRDTSLYILYTLIATTNDATGNNYWTEGGEEAISENKGEEGVKGIE